MCTALPTARSLLKTAEDETKPLPDRLGALHELNGRAVNPHARPHELLPTDVVRRDLAAARLAILLAERGGELAARGVVYRVKEGQIERSPRRSGIMTGEITHGG
jgi:hypothetical protein